jgi:hypothetical protein
MYQLSTTYTQVQMSSQFKGYCMTGIYFQRLQTDMAGINVYYGFRWRGSGSRSMCSWVASSPLGLGDTRSKYTVTTWLALDLCLQFKGLYEEIVAVVGVWCRRWLSDSAAGWLVPLLAVWHRCWVAGATGRWLAPLLGGWLMT